MTAQPIELLTPEQVTADEVARLNRELSEQNKVWGSANRSAQVSAELARAIVRHAKTLRAVGSSEFFGANLPPKYAPPGMKLRGLPNKYGRYAWKPFAYKSKDVKLTSFRRILEHYTGDDATAARILAAMQARHTD